MVHAWHRSTGTVTIDYILSPRIYHAIRHINLYFYSITSMGIGLPSVTVSRGSTAQVVEYQIFGNDDIAQEDNMRRQILLSLRSTSSSRFYTLQFDFENTDVDWLVLSETRLCRFPLQGVHKYSLSHIECTVVTINRYSSKQINGYVCMHTAILTVQV